VRHTYRVRVIIQQLCLCECLLTRQFKILENGGRLCDVPWSGGFISHSSHHTHILVRFPLSQVLHERELIGINFFSDNKLSCLFQDTVSNESEPNEQCYRNE
jgi:hypothetical protein